MFGSEGGLNNGVSPSTTLTFAGEVRDVKLDEEAMNRVRRGVTGWTKTGFVARDDSINERKSMVVRGFYWCVSCSTPLALNSLIRITGALPYSILVISHMPSLAT